MNIVYSFTITGINTYNLSQYLKAIGKYFSIFTEIKKP
jgi:hypothetical protein